MRAFISSRSFILIILGCLLSVLGGWILVYFGGNFQTFLYIVLLFAGMAVITAGRRMLQIGFLVWIWMFIIGYRTIHLTSDFELHPLILFLLLLSFILLIQLRSSPGIRLKLPSLLWAFSIFWVWGFITGFLRGYSWSLMLSVAQDFFFILPLFWIMLYLSRTPGFWKSATLTFFGSGVLISLIGTIEYNSPQFRSILPGFIQTNVEGLGSPAGFVRASFAFFGANPAVLICALAMPMVVLVPRFFNRGIGLLFSMLCLAILGVGIYISGTRDAWLMVLVASILLAYFYF